MSESPAPRRDFDVAGGSGAGDGTPLPLFNASVVQVPFPITVLQPFAPSHVFPYHGHAIDTKVLWKSTPAAASSNVRSLQALSRNRNATSVPTSTTPAPRSPTPGPESDHDFVIVTGHHLGHLLVWDLDKNTLVGSCLHFNNATVTHIVVTSTLIYSVVEKQNGKGSSGDDIDIYVWKASSFALVEKLAAHDDRVTSLCVDDYNEKRLATGGADHQVFLWDLGRKSAGIPIGKIDLTHGHIVSQVKLSREALITGGGDGEIRLYDVSDPSSIKCLQSFDGHQGQIVHFNWFVRPAASNGFQGVLCSACNGGLVRGWYVTTDREDGEVEGKKLSMEQSFFNKAHKAMVTDVVCDRDIVVSCSSSDGLTFFNQQQKTNFKSAGIDGGVRCLCIDAKREIVIAGSDKGHVFFFDYSNFVQPSRFHEDPVTMIATLQPHNGSITAILLEVGLSGEWSRLVTTSADGTVVKLDFELNRDARVLGSLTTTQTGVVRTPLHNFCIPLQSATSGGATPALGLAGSGNAALYCKETVTLLSGNQTKTDGKTGTRVVAMELCEDLQSVVVAFDDSVIKSFVIRNFADDETTTPSEYLQPLSGPGLDLNPFQIRLLSSMPTGVTATAVSMVKGLNSRNGYIALVDVSIDPIVQCTDVATLPLPCIAASVHTYSVRTHAAVTAPDPNAIIERQSFAVVCQLRNGEIQLFTATRDSRSLNLLRVVVRDQLGSSSLNSESSQLSLDSVAARWPTPCRFISSILTKYEPARVNLVYVEGMRNLRSIEASTGPDNAIPCQFTSVFNFDILQVCALNQGSLAFVVCVDGSTAYVTGAKGEVLFEIQYDGDVADTVQLEVHHNTRGVLSTSSTAQKKHRTLIPEVTSASPFSRRFPACCFVTFNTELRLVLLGYRDGVVQLWDVNTHRVCYRIHAHASPIVGAWIFGDERRLFSTATAGTLRVDTVWPKTLRDAKNNSSATPATTPITQTLAMGGMAPPLSL